MPEEFRAPRLRDLALPAGDRRGDRRKPRGEQPLPLRSAEDHRRVLCRQPLRGDAASWPGGTACTSIARRAVPRRPLRRPAELESLRNADGRVLGLFAPPPYGRVAILHEGRGHAAHVYGRKIACGEGFTSIGPHWNDMLWSSQKPTFDHECAGFNLMYWHAFTCSPPEAGRPASNISPARISTPASPGLARPPPSWPTSTVAIISCSRGNSWPTCLLQRRQRAKSRGPQTGRPGGGTAGIRLRRNRRGVLLDRVTVREDRIEVPGGRL